ncbi:hypothetical protein [Polaribacter staleyi]|uniref:hypothetical protein n=1 Tax=Polaribacter staleyi TaxID=2022337 RepID=UPI0031BB4640
MSDGKIRIKDIEGDAGQITDLCKNLGFDLNSYLNEKPVKKQINKIWIYITVPLFFILCCLVWAAPLNPSLFKVLILGLFLLLGAIVVIIQFNHDNWMISGISGITGICLILISLNVYTPQEIIKKIEKQTTNKLNEE